MNHFLCSFASRSLLIKGSQKDSIPYIKSFKGFCKRPGCSKFLLTKKEFFAGISTVGEKDLSPANHAGVLIDMSP